MIPSITQREQMAGEIRIAVEQIRANLADDKDTAGFPAPVIGFIAHWLDVEAERLGDGYLTNAWAPAVGVARYVNQGEVVPPDTEAADWPAEEAADEEVAAE